jgi:hypothetical protein
MSKRIWNLRFLSISLLMGSLLGLASCAPSVVAEGQLKPTPAASVTLPQYPGPTQFNSPPLTLSPSPAQVNQNRGWRVTPLPNEPLIRGEIIEIRPTASPVSPYSIRKDSQPSSYGFLNYRLFVRNTKTGDDVRLGDDEGDATFHAMTDQYVIWHYGRYTHDEKANPKTGLYAYVLATGEQIPIGGGGHAEANGHWVIYMSNEGVKDHAGLRAHNLVTGEDFRLTSALAEFRGYLMRDLYAVNENKIAWVDVDPVTNELAIAVSDPDTQTRRKLDIPPLTQPLYISVSNEFVTWRDGFWKGYSLKQNVLFTIPIIPPGWESMLNYQAWPVTVQGNRLYWSFKVDDEFYYFTAPILPKGQGGQPTHIVPTPHRKPTASPIFPSPTPIPLPTTYP